MPPAFWADAGPAQSASAATAAVADDKCLSMSLSLSLLWGASLTGCAVLSMADGPAMLDIPREMRETARGRASYIRPAARRSAPNAPNRASPLCTAPHPPAALAPQHDPARLAPAVPRAGDGLLRPVRPGDGGHRLLRACFRRRASVAPAA